MSIMFQKTVLLPKLPPQCQAFYQDFIAATAEVTNDDCVTYGDKLAWRQFGPDEEAVGIKLVHGGFKPNQKNTTITLDDFKAAQMGEGHGSFALEGLTELADKHKIRLELRAQPTVGVFEKNGAFIPVMPEQKLWSFYEKHGFFLPPKANHCAPIMIRPPQRSWK